MQPRFPSLLRLAAFLVFGGLMAGCESSRALRYQATGKSLDDLLQARYECLKETQQQAWSVIYGRSTTPPTQAVLPTCSAFHACLAARGYVRVERGGLAVPKGLEIDCKG